MTRGTARLFLFFGVYNLFLRRAVIKRCISRKDAETQKGCSVVQNLPLMGCRLPVNLPANVTHPLKVPRGSSSTAITSPKFLSSTSHKLLPYGVQATIHEQTLNQSGHAKPRARPTSARRDHNKDTVTGCTHPHHDTKTRTPPAGLTNTFCAEGTTLHGTATGRPRHTGVPT